MNYQFALVTHKGHCAETLGWAYGTQSLRIFTSEESRDKWVEKDPEWQKAITQHEAKEWMIAHSDAWVIESVYGNAKNMSLQDALNVYLEHLVSTTDFPREELTRTFAEGISKSEINEILDKVKELRKAAI